MPAQLELNLALILFLPWYLVLGGLFWIYPRMPRTWRRRAFDAASLGLAVLAAAFGTYWSFHGADSSAGPIWKQVLATTVSYGLFLLVMTLAFFLRRRLIAMRRLAS